MHRKLAAPILVALALTIGGCAGSSSPTSIPQTQSIHQTSNGAHLYSFHGRTIAGPFASQLLNDQWAHRSVNPNIGVVTNYPGAKCTNAFRLYGSDNTTGNLDVFCEDGAKLVKTIAGVAGWGLAVNGKQLAVGKSGGTIGIYNAATAASLNITLTLSGAGSGDNAYGVCFDNKGGLYATNWPSNVINYWKGPLTNGEAITSSATTTTITEDYYVACDSNLKEQGNNTDLMVYGFNSNTGDSDVAIVKLPNGPETVEQTLGNLNSGNGFPGGLAFSATDDLLANDQYGTLYDLGKVEPWHAAPTGSCTWGFNPNDFTNIAYDNTQKEVWASNINFGGSSVVTYLQSVGAPPLSGTCVTPGESGGPTAPIAGEGSYLGVAVYPNLGN